MEAVMYDMKNLSKIKNLVANAPQAMNAFVAFDKAALGEGAIPRKYKELMALAVAFTTQCPYCVELHANKARRIQKSPNPFSSLRPCAQVGRSPTVRTL
jgi:AhpD family alkylhydroperoxidase